MAIKMRNSKDPDAVCCECWKTANESLGMFDICIGGTIHTLCDLCTDKVLSKTLSAIVSVNGRVKSQHDMAIIRRRKSHENFSSGISVNEAMK